MSGIAWKVFAVLAVLMVLLGIFEFVGGIVLSRPSLFVYAFLQFVFAVTTGFSADTIRRVSS